MATFTRVRGYLAEQSKVVAEAREDIEARFLNDKIDRLTKGGRKGESEHGIHIWNALTGRFHIQE